MYLSKLFTIKCFLPLNFRVSKIKNISKNNQKVDCRKTLTLQNKILYFVNVF
jgi:hypothetical protein